MIALTISSAFAGTQHVDLDYGAANAAPLLVGIDVALSEVMVATDLSGHVSNVDRIAKKVGDHALPLVVGVGYNRYDAPLIRYLSTKPWRPSCTLWERASSPLRTRCTASQWWSTA